MKAFCKQMPNLVFNMQDAKGIISLLAAQKNKESIPYLEYQIDTIRTILAKSQDDFLSSEINLSSEMQSFRDVIISKMHYSTIQCVIWLRHSILLQMKKGSSAGCPLKELDFSAIRHQQSHMDAVLWLSFYCVLSVVRSPSLTHWCSLSCEPELILLLYNQSNLSESNRPLFNQPINSTDSASPPQALFQECYKQEEFGQQFTQVGFLIILSPLKKNASAKPKFKAVFLSAGGLFFFMSYIKKYAALH